MVVKLAIANVADSRPDFYNLRKSLVDEETKEIEWLRRNYSPLESDIIRSYQDVNAFIDEASVFDGSSLVIHIPIWADPIFTVRLAVQLPLPILLLGNNRPETSSMVGVLGAGGALDQIGRSHTRIFDSHNEASRKPVHAFIRAASALKELRGQTLGLFGERSLGIFTTVADPAQLQKLFGVDVQYIDQMEIVKTAEEIPSEEVARHKEWLAGRVGGIRYKNGFTPLAFERQVRSYLATRDLVKFYGINFLGVKCQPELSDGYVTQCVSHMLFNGALDADGEKQTTVHACESDIDGALTMQILRLLSGGKPVSLMDIRWLDAEKGIWTLANCGALAAAFFATQDDPTGFSHIHMEPHAFGAGGGGALPGIVAPQEVTMARLCRKDGVYWMAILPGQVLEKDGVDTRRTTPAFPKAFVKSEAGYDFLSVFGSNHIHMVSGDVTEEIKAFCNLAGIRWQIWS